MRTALDVVRDLRLDGDDLLDDLDFVRYVIADRLDAEESDWTLSEVRELVAEARHRATFAYLRRNWNDITLR